MRKETKAMKSIRMMYDSLSLSHHEIFHKTKMILAVYRDVVWASIQKADNIYEIADNLYGQDLSTALTYLADFAPTEERERFEMRVSSLFETKWMVDLIDSAMLRVYNYHSNGMLYHGILSKCYLTALKYTESEILEAINIDRSVFYDRKKEAVMLLGIALWGYAIPQFRGIFGDSVPGDFQVPAYFTARI